uniref:Alpha-ketoglutarate-dependent dioxygenase FTO n=1 Tax=Cyprinodon variegatus TaxID=28743 RepID=A0A3Q2FYJ8_CYPVA
GKRSDFHKENLIQLRRLQQELGGRKIPFLGPSARGFQQLWDSSYSGLALRKSCSLPAELHSRVQAALLTLRRKGCLLKDLVRIRDRDVFTAVSRALVGEPGHTYRYLDTRLFAIPWHSEDTEVKRQNCCDPDLRDACKALWELNTFLCSDVSQIKEGDREDSKNSEGGDSESRQSEEGDTESKHSEEWDIESKHSEEGGSGCSQPSSPQACTGPVKFNVTLLNYMDPAQMSHLKEEPYYGMGKMAVGWHHDENLITHSPVAVYNYSCHDDKGKVKEKRERKSIKKIFDLLKKNGRGECSEGGSGEKSCWRIGLKVAWDIHTPGLMLPLESGDCYYMRDDLNSTHQHCVLAGETPRFSSTHRVAECSKGTLTYIQSRCQEALSNLHTDPETGSHSLVTLQPTALQHCEEIHNEVEFEWLRQYWFQGQRYARFCSWWSRPMEQLEKDWKLMETMTMLFLATVEEEGQEEEGRREMAETLLSALTDRHQQRQTWRDRCHSSLAQTLPPEEAPVDRPFWGVDDPGMPLPFDLAEIISRVESLLWR